MSPLTTTFISIALSVAAQFALKAGMSGSEIRGAMSQPLNLRTFFLVATNLQVLLGFLLYGLGAVVWLGVLSKWDVSKAYPLVGVGFALTVAIGFLAGEAISFSRIAGVALICGGVFLVSRS
jgi:multidrug transporter EmrE-like cation transporter